MNDLERLIEEEHEKNSIARDIKKAIKEYRKVFAKNMIAMQNHIVKDSPVDTGRFKTNWKYEPINFKEFRFFMWNNVKYGSILWKGFKVVNGKAYGSKKGWGLNGGDIVVESHIQNMQRDWDKNKVLGVFMAYINGFDLEKEVIKKINEELANNPLDDGYIQINKIFRGYEAKTKDKNFISVSFVYSDQQENHQGDLEVVKVNFWFFFENEILTIKFSKMFKDRFLDFTIIDFIRLIGLRSVLGIDEYDKNLYGAKLEATIKN